MERPLEEVLRWEVDALRRRALVLLTEAQIMPDTVAEYLRDRAGSLMDQAERLAREGKQYTEAERINQEAVDI